MSFPLVHFIYKLFLFNKNGTNILKLFNTNSYSDVQSKPSNCCEIDMTYNFSSQSTPSTTDITLHNLTKRDFSKFKKDETISIYAGWIDSDWTQSNITHIFTSTISTVGPIINSAGDWQMSVTCQDGNKFSGGTALSKIYKSKSRSVRSGASDSLGRSAISSINRLFKGKRNKLTEYCKGKNVSIKKARRIAIKTFEQERKDLVKQRKKLKGRKTPYARNIRNELDQERNNIRQHQNAVRNILSERSKRVTHYRQHRSKTLRRQENHEKTLARGKRERAKRSKSRQKSKAKKTQANGYHFKKNTTGKTIINKLAKLGHIHISQMNLVKNHRFTSGYTAVKTPWQEIQTVAQDYCNSNIWWPHGKLYIGNFAKHKRLSFTLTPSTGLMQSPEPQDDDADDDADDSSTGDDDTSTKTPSKKQAAEQQKQDAIANPTVYQVTSTFLPFITTGSTFRIVDPDKTMITNLNNDEPVDRGSIFNDEVTVKDGELEFGSSSPTCTLDVVTTSALVKKQQQSDSKQALAAKQKARKDHKKRSKIRVKRAKRAHVRKARVHTRRR